MKHNSYANKLAVGHCNIQGGLTSLVKCLEIQNLIHREKLDILCLNETNLKSDIDTHSLNTPHNFTLVRKDRVTDDGHGGCGILVSNNVKFKNVQLDLFFPTDKIEAIWIDLVECNTYICGFYRSEKFCPLDTFLDYMTECMLKMGGKKVIWLGDINVNQNNISSINYKKLDVTMRLFGLIQTVQEITRIAKLGDRITQPTIDVVMTNTYSNFISCLVLDDRIGDHQAIKFILDYNVMKASKFKKILIRDHCERNMCALKDFLTQYSDYQPILNSTNVNEAAEGLNAHIHYYYNQFCPIKQIKCHSDYIYKPTKELLTNIKLRRKLYRKFKRHKNKIKLHPVGQTTCSKCDELWNDYKVQRNLTTKISRINKRDNVISELKAKSYVNDLKGVWKVIKRASNLPVKATNNSNNLDANETNTYFATIGTRIQAEVSQGSGNEFRDYLERVNCNPNDQSNLCNFNEVSEGDLLEFIQSIPVDKSTNDPIPLRIFKDILPSFISPFTHIVNLSLKTGIYTSPVQCLEYHSTSVFQ